jgi:aryl-alcohol dehydrogenase-like predicted oxidoreductase
MDTKPLGHSGLRVASVGLGCMNFGAMCDQAATDAIVGTALDAGIDFFDVADIYGGPSGKAETLLGKALGPRRAGIVLATKFGAKLGGRGGAAERGGSRDYIVQALEQSLARLGTDYVDLYQHHFPDPGTPVEETLRALEDLVAAGKVRHIGCSNYSGEQLKAATIAAKAGHVKGYVSAQNRYSLLFRDIEKDLVPIAQAQQVGIIPYFPLESGLLSGKYRRGEKPPADTRFGKWGGGGVFVSDARWATVARLEAYAATIGRSLLDLAIGWLAAQPWVSSVIAGVTNPDQVRANVKAASWSPTPEQLAKIDEITAP